MTQSEDPPKTLKDLMSYVGYLLLRWGVTESAMREVVAKAAPGARPPQGSALVRAWLKAAQQAPTSDPGGLARLDEAARVLKELRPLRDLICHGIESATDPADGVGEPYLTCRLHAEHRAVPWSELDDAIRRMEGISGAFYQRKRGVGRNPRTKTPGSPLPRG